MPSDFQLPPPASSAGFLSPLTRDLSSPRREPSNDAKVSEIAGFIKKPELSPHSAAAAALSAAVFTYLDDERVNEGKTSPELAPRKPRRDYSKPLEAYMSMQRNLEKAFKQLRKEATPSEKAAFVSKVEWAGLGAPPVAGLRLNHFGFSDIGEHRTDNQDVHFVKTIKINEVEVGTLAGVLDGHHGIEVAQFVEQVFPQIFTEQLAIFPDNLRRVFDLSVMLTQQAIEKALPNSEAGSVAAICFFEKASGRTFTLTIGDAQAFALRIVKGKWKLIPMSLVRGWGHPKEAKRADSQLLLMDERHNSINAEIIARRLLEGNLDPRLIRLKIGTHLNMSRSWGDKSSECVRAGILHEGKSAVFQHKPGDLVLILCDGITDFLLKHHIRDIVAQRISSGIERVVVELIEAAKTEMRTRTWGDNATVLMLQVLPPQI